MSRDDFRICDRSARVLIIIGIVVIIVWLVVNRLSGDINDWLGSCYCCNNETCSDTYYDDVHDLCVVSPLRTTYNRTASRQNCEGNMT